VIESRILTLHPQGKQGVNIKLDKYEAVRQAIVETLMENGELSFKELGEAIGQKLSGRFEGSIGWYYTTVKLDLEARQVIERVKLGGQQRLRLVQNSS
jgi:hypothetical protein